MTKEEGWIKVGPVSDMALDGFAESFGLSRDDNESDESLRARMRDTMNAQRAEIPKALEELEIIRAGQVYLGDSSRYYTVSGRIYGPDTYKMVIQSCDQDHIIYDSYSKNGHVWEQTKKAKIAARKPFEDEIRGGHLKLEEAVNFTELIKAI